MKKFVIVTFLFTGLLLLVGCTSNNPDTAVEYLKALSQRDLSTAEGLVCPARQDDVEMGLTSSASATEPFSFTNISCATQGDGVMCRFVVEQGAQNANATGSEHTRQVVFNYENGKICGFEEQVAQ